MVLGIIKTDGDNFAPHLNLPDEKGTGSRRSSGPASQKFSDLGLGEGIGLQQRKRLPPFVGLLPVEEQQSPNRILILGWNEHVPSLIRELGTYADENYFIRLITLRPVSEREKDLAFLEEDNNRVRVEHVVADFIRESEIRKIDSRNL